MTVSSPGIGEDFSARVIFKQDAVTPVRWACTHELSSPSGGTPFGTWLNFANALKEFHRYLLLPYFKIERVVISTLAEDSEPYNPDNLAVFEYNEDGIRTGGDTDCYDLRTVLHVKRDVDFGREGNMLLRGFLREGDVESVAGTTRLADLEAVQLEISAALSGGGLTEYLAGGLGDLTLMMIKPGLLNNIERPVKGFHAHGITSKKINNKYFRKVLSIPTP